MRESGEDDVFELVELRAWLDYYKANREFLLTGDLVRVDGAKGTVERLSP